MAEKKKQKTHPKKVKETPLKPTTQLINEITRTEGIINAIGDGLTILDRTFKVLYENQVHRDMMGDHVGEHCYKAYQKREGICDGCPVALTFKDGNVYKVQREVHTDEETRYLEITASPLKDTTGQVIAGIELVRDITERNQAENKILLANERLNHLLSSTNAIIYAAKISGDYGATFISENVKQMSGYESHKFIEDSSFWFQHIHLEDQPKVEEEVAKIFGRKTHHCEYRFQRQDGTYIWVRDEMKLVQDENGKPLEIIGFWSDITERKRLEEQLLQAQKMESIGTLSGGIANDFNNILTAIIGFGGLLKTEMTEHNPLMIYVTRILSAAERAAILTRSLLAFSRTQIINQRPVDLNEIVKAMEYSLDRLIGDNIEFSTVLTDEDLTISADTYLMQKVLIHLVTNAMDAMQDGGSLIIRTERVELDNKFIEVYGYGKSGTYAFLSIEDSGQGMDEETKARIFEPFFSTKEVREKSGLGLSMVYGTINQHEGYINVYSELGKGTTFKIYLPLIESTAEAIKEATSHKLNGGTEKVLVAENDAEVRETIKKVLKGSGYTVVEAENGEKAIRVFHENREGIQLLILNVLMPKKNGIEVFDEIRKVRPDMKAIFTSGYDIDVIQKKGFLEEEHDFISKPILPNKLLRKVREVLDS